MEKIEASAKIVKKFEKLKKEIKKIYPAQDLDNDQILDAMINWFLDSLEYMKAHPQEIHQHHDDHECCGSGKCEDDWKCKCC